jgi:hypothetical protein
VQAADPVTGSRRYLTRTVRGGKRVAQWALVAPIVEAGENGAPRRGTFAELLEEWFAHAEPDSAEDGGAVEDQERLNGELHVNPGGASPCPRPRHGPPRDPGPAAGTALSTTIRVAPWR